MRQGITFSFGFIGPISVRDSGMEDLWISVMAHFERKQREIGTDVLLNCVILKMNCMVSHSETMWPVPGLGMTSKF